jgi:Nitrate reductase delta subunit
VTADPDRWELLRALGAVAGDPADARRVADVLGLAGCGNAEHTEVFVLNCPPYAAVYLGAEGGLGGEAADRVAGFWRALGVTAPAEPDHLSSLLSLYAQLGSLGSPMEHAREALFWEHLWPWLPGYLAAVGEIGVAGLTEWAGLLSEAIAAETPLSEDALSDAPPSEAPLPEASMPVALRDAPPPLGGDCPVAELVAALVTPVRSGMILTRRALASGAGQAGAGHRIGERRFALRAMLEQEPERTLGWLAGEADRWSARHLAVAAADPVRQWWADRAASTAGVLRDAARR